MQTSKRRATSVVRGPLGLVGLAIAAACFGTAALAEAPPQANAGAPRPPPSASASTTPKPPPSASATAVPPPKDSSPPAPDFCPAPKAPPEGGGSEPFNPDDRWLDESNQILIMDRDPNPLLPMPSKKDTAPPATGGGIDKIVSEQEVLPMDGQGDRPFTPSVVAAAETADDFADVVAVGSALRYHCTGILVAPRWVLTARHCLPATRVLFGRSVASRSVERKVERSDTPPDPHLDVALLQLNEAANVKVRPRRSARDQNPPLGRVRLVGFGANDARGSDGFGVKRMVDVLASGWGCDGARPTTLACRAEAEMVLPTQGGRDTCNGDSGGPVLEYVDSRFRLLAITSRPIPGAHSACGEGGIYVRVDRFASWMDQVVAKGG